MRDTLAQGLAWLASRLTTKAGGASPVVRGGTGSLGPVDAHGKVRVPTPNELVKELKNLAYACATLNAGVCASYPPKLYVTTSDGQPAARVTTRDIPKGLSHRLLEQIQTKGVRQIQEVVEHPLLVLFRTVNEELNQWDLWELTTLYQEVTGSAYWLLADPVYGVPTKIWVVPSQQVRPVRLPQSRHVVDYYEVRHNNGEVQRHAPEEIIHFKYPDPVDPYGAGRAPLRACWEHVLLDSEYTALKRAKFTNHALPGVILSPEEVLTEDEAHRLESEWNAKMLRGGQGRALVAESKLNVQLLSQQLGDLSALAEVGASKEIIANAFGVPVSYLFRETNLANMQAADLYHAGHTIRPRLLRRDEKINERLIPLFDPTGRLFVASEDPRLADKSRIILEQSAYVQNGVKTINEVRSDLGLQPVAWGDVPPWQQQQPQPAASAGVEGQPA